MLEDYNLEAQNNYFIETDDQFIHGQNFNSWDSIQ
jgi:hypothetical protein